MMAKPSFTQLVTQVLMTAGHPLTLAEVKARVEMFRPVDTRKSQATVRNAINSVRLIASLGERLACDGAVTKRKRRKMDGSISCLYRHERGEGMNCPLRYNGLRR